MRVWAVRVIDADPATRKGKSEVVVKVSADHQPVPPPAIAGMPFRPIEFDELTVTPYVDDNGSRARQAFSFRALGIKAATKPAVIAPKSVA